jgi:hypothetical protein
MSLIPNRYRCPDCDGYLHTRHPALRCTCPEPLEQLDAHVWRWRDVMDFRAAQERRAVEIERRGYV